MLRINQLGLPVGHTRRELEDAVRKLLKCEEVPEITIVRRSIDARKKPKLYFNYILNIKVKNQPKVYRRCDKRQVLVWEEKKYRFPVKNYRGEVRPVIIGMGPAGLFCGYMLASAGFRPILLERGDPVEKRTKAVHTFWESGKLDTESNVQFGEGGAGTFSDGKLNTLVKDKYGRNKEVLSLFVKMGAPPEILYDHKPHIGTDVLSKVVINLRNAILAMGGEVRFRAKVTDIVCEEIDKNRRITDVIINEKEHLKTSCVVSAPGHSARDTIAMLYGKGIAMEAKPFAVGMRVEHPQELINLSQYGVRQEDALGNAVYKVTANISPSESLCGTGGGMDNSDSGGKESRGRGVYSFCMCPGGYVVNASSEPGRLAVNGMSYSGRDGKNANSAIIVSVTPEDYGDNHPLAGIEFQRRLEERAFAAGGGKIPVERYGDYRAALQRDFGGRTEGRPPAEEEAEGNLSPASGNLAQTEASLIQEDFKPCIKGCWTFGPVHEILPDFLGKAFVRGMEQFGRVIKGFNDKNALVEGIESRTSSPVRILRNEGLQSSIKGLYPCGEGAGYAGGITSAAMDGIRVAEEVALALAGEATGAGVKVSTDTEGGRG